MPGWLQDVIVVLFLVMMLAAMGIFFLTDNREVDSWIIEQRTAAMEKR